MSQLPGWDGLYSTDDYGNGTYQKTAVIWRTDRANINYIEALFPDNWYQFPRPPLHVYGDITFGGHQFDFHLIVLHLKAGSTNDDWLRRRAGVIMLKSYLDNTVPGSDDQDWIVLGDWNDELEDPEDDNVFWPLLEDSTDYTFLTLPLAGIPYWASYPYFNSLIDHIMITSDALAEYGNGNTITLRIDDEYSNYSYRISDHRPVMSQFDPVVSSVDDDHEIAPSSFEIMDIYPNPFNSSTVVSVTLEDAAYLKLVVYDILGREIATVMDGYYSEGTHLMQLGEPNWISGVYFVRLTSGDYNQTKKMVLLK